MKNKGFNERYNEYKHMIMIAANNAARRIATRTALKRQNQQQYVRLYEQHFLKYIIEMNRNRIL